MPSSERHGAAGSGLLVEPFWFLAFQNGGFFVSAQTDFTVGFVTLFTNFQNVSVPFPRTITLFLTSSGDAGTRRIRVRLLGKDQFGETIEEVVDSIAQTLISTTFKVESKKVYAFLKSVEVLTGSVKITTDSWSLGYGTAAAGNDVNGVLHARTIFWGIPFKLVGTRFDSTAGSEGFRCEEDIVLSMVSILPGVASTNFVPNLGGVGEDPRDLRFDSSKNAFRWVANFIDFAVVAPIIYMLVKRPAGN